MIFIPKLFAEMILNDKYTTIHKTNFSLSYDPFFTKKHLPLFLDNAALFMKMMSDYNRRMVLYVFDAVKSCKYKDQWEICT